MIFVSRGLLIVIRVNFIVIATCCLDGLFGSSCGVFSEADISRLKKKNIVIRFQGEHGMVRQIM